MCGGYYPITLNHTSFGLQEDFNIYPLGLEEIYTSITKRKQLLSGNLATELASAKDTAVEAESLNWLKKQFLNAQDQSIFADMQY